MHNNFESKTKVFDKKLIKKLKLELLARIVRLELDDDMIDGYLTELEQFLTYAEEEYKSIRKDYHKVLNALLAHLKNKYDLEPKGTLEAKYIAIGIAVGTSLGIALGTTTPAFNSIGISMGLVFGVALGKKKEKEAEDAGKLI